jgi:hypothetical protein
LLQALAAHCAEAWLLPLVKIVIVEQARLLHFKNILVKG